MRNEEILKTLQNLSKLTGFSVVAIDYIAWMIAQADYDPLPPNEWGEPFEFPQRKLSVIGDEELDFDCIHADVPKPDSQFDFRVAWKEYKRDLKAIAAIYAGHPDLSLGPLWKTFMRQWEWDRLWAARHLDPKIRGEFERSFKKTEALRKRFAEKAKALLRKRGVLVS